MHAFFCSAKAELQSFYFATLHGLSEHVVLWNVLGSKQDLLPPSYIENSEPLFVLRLQRYHFIQPFAPGYPSQIGRAIVQAAVGCL
jgi:hypothetical protein